MDLDKLKTILEELRQPAYRFNQIKLAVYRDLKDGFGSIDNIPLALRGKLDRLMRSYRECPHSLRGWHPYCVRIH